MDWELSIKHLLSGYVPVAAALALLFIFLSAAGKKRTPGHIIVSFVFCFYLVGILTMTGIWFLSTFAPRIVYIPFLDMIRGPVQTLLNILLFIPLGVFLPILYKRYDSIGKVVLAGFLISLSVEIVQMFGCGTSDINDLITNTLGTCIGFCISKFICRIIPKAWLKSIRIDGLQGCRELLLFCMISLVIMITVQPLIFHVWFASTVSGEIAVWK